MAALLDCWVGGHWRVVEGAAPETPVDEEPPVSRRASRRVKGENPPLLDGVLETAALKKLAPGGMGGRVTGDGKSWRSSLGSLQTNGERFRSITTRKNC